MTYFRDKIDSERVIELYLSGLSGLEVAEAIGRAESVRHVQRLVRDAGIVRSRSEAYINAIARGRMVYEKTTERRLAHRRYISPKLRSQILARDGYKCVQCGATAQTDRLEIDHINNDPSDDRSGNLQVLCQSCNLGKEALYKQELKEQGLERPKPRGKLPSPTTIIFCKRCDDVTLVKEDRQGQFCEGCRRSIG